MKQWRTPAVYHQRPTPSPWRPPDPRSYTICSASQIEFYQKKNPFTPKEQWIEVVKELRVKLQNYCVHHVENGEVCGRRTLTKLSEEPRNPKEMMFVGLLTSLIDCAPPINHIGFIIIEGAEISTTNSQNASNVCRKLTNIVRKKCIFKWNHIFREFSYTDSWWIIELIDATTCKRLFDPCSGLPQVDVTDMN